MAARRSRLRSRDAAEAGCHGARRIAGSSRTPSAGLDRGVCSSSAAKKRSGSTPFALFVALKERHGGRAWWDWPAERSAATMPAVPISWRANLAEPIELHKFRQFLFFGQWRQLRRVCPPARHPPHRRHADLRLQRLGRCLVAARTVSARRRPAADVRRRRAARLFFRDRPALGQSAVRLGASTARPAIAWWIEPAASTLAAGRSGAARSFSRLRGLLGRAGRQPDGRARLVGARPGRRAVQRARSGAGRRCR